MSTHIVLCQSLNKLLLAHFIDLQVEGGQTSSEPVSLITTGLLFFSPVSFIYLFSLSIKKKSVSQWRFFCSD